MPAILYLPCFDYFHHRQRPQSLLWELSKRGFRVIYCQPPSYAIRAAEWAGRHIWPAGEKYQPPWPLIPLTDNFIICTDVAAVKDLRPDVMWLTHGPYAESVVDFDPKLVVSDFADVCKEEFEEFAPFETAKLSCADVAVAASKAIYDDISQRHPNAHLVPNAADYGLFRMAWDTSYNLPVPLEISTILGIQNPVPDSARVASKKLIAFWGAITTWVDLDLVIRIAARKPAWHFIFIGSIALPMSSLPRLPNIIFLGDRDHLSLPFYARWFDAAIIPFEVREVTRSACPIKAYEYLACGLPVVSTDLPEIRGLGDIKIIDSSSGQVEGFIDALEWALSQSRDPDAKRLRAEAVKDETWENRAKMVKDLISEYIEM